MMGASELIPLSFQDFLMEGLGNNLPEKEVTFSGIDLHGRYKAQVLFKEKDWLPILANIEDYLPDILETRRYFYENGQIRRIAKTLNDRAVSIEEWSEDGVSQRITCYEEEGEWIWKKNADHRTHQEGIFISSESYFFSTLSEEHIQALESGRFHPELPFEKMDDSCKEAILEILGAERAATQLSVEIIDSFGSNRLLRASLARAWRFLELHCSSTGKISYLRVPPDFNDVLSAIAWTFSMNKENYQLEAET